METRGKHLVWITSELVGVDGRAILFNAKHPDEKRKHPDILAGRQALIGGGKREDGMACHRHACLIKSREPLSKGFDKLRPYTKLFGNIVKVGDVGGETTGRSCALRNVTLDRDTAAADAAPVARRRGCGRTS